MIFLRVLFVFAYQSGREGAPKIGKPIKSWGSIFAVQVHQKDFSKNGSLGSELDKTGAKIDFCENILRRSRVWRRDQFPERNPPDPLFFGGGEQIRGVSSLGGSPRTAAAKKWRGVQPYEFFENPTAVVFWGWVVTLMVLFCHGGGAKTGVGQIRRIVLS